MALKINFNQTELIDNTGNQISIGICLGLVTQWLISISKGILGDENAFWKDLNSSLETTDNVPLLGVGYARKAIEFQSEYVINISPDPSIGEFTRTKLEESSLKFEFAFYRYNNMFVNGALETVIDSITDSNRPRYFILGIIGTGGAHAIGIYRRLLNSEISIFDPNIGKYVASTRDEIKQDLIDIGNHYGNGLHEKYLLEGYK